MTINIKEYRRQYYLRNRDKAISAAKQYYANNKELVLQQHREYRAKNRARLRKNARAYVAAKKENIAFKLRTNLRTRLYRALKNNVKTGSSVTDLGCSIEFLKSHLEKQFTPGMTWSNWTRDGWHIDHIIPLTRFDLNVRDELLKACHYSNLRPMWAKENISKGNK